MLEFYKNLGFIEKGYFYIALAGTVFFVLQTIFTFLDLGDHFESDTNFDGEIDTHFHFFGLGLPFNLFSIRGIVGFIMIFGLAGFTFSYNGKSHIVTFLLALLCGFIMMVIIALMYYFAMKLTESGEINLVDAKGKIGQVYLFIPEKNTGIGKVHIVLNGTLRELDAVTLNEVINSGEMVVVTDIINDKLVVEKNK